MHERIQGLVERADQAGERTSLRELLAAIVCAFDPNEDELREVLRRYRLSRVRDVTLKEPDDENVIRIDRQGRGRPRHVSR